MKGIQTLDISSNKLSLAGAKALAKALWRCRSLHEIVLEESVAADDTAAVSAVFKEYMPWATVRVDDRDGRKNLARRYLAAGGGHGQAYDAADDDQGAFSDDEEDGDNNNGGGHGDNGDLGFGLMDPHHWEAVDAESDGEVPPELMMDDDTD
ncbi:unnamed protein product [Ectocarpus fasciculatus]